MKIEVLGAGCTNCRKLYEAVVEAVKQSGIDAEVIKVEEIAEIVKRGVLFTPSLVVDGKVICSGRVLKAHDIATRLKNVTSAGPTDD